MPRTKKYPFGSHFAAKRWKKMTAEQPDEGQTVLIFADYNGLTAMDVAFYNGRNPDGSHWWTLANVEIAQRCIIAWAVLEEPDFDDRL